MTTWRSFFFLWLVFTAFSTVMAIVRLTHRVILIGWDSDIFSGWRLFVLPPIAAALMVGVLGWLVMRNKEPPPKRGLE